MSEQEILARYESPKGQKTPKNGLSATFLTHRKQSLENEDLEGQSWENEDLEGKMSTKLGNSNGVTNYTGQAFQQAHLGTLWTPASSPK